jgi:hypothetical protein
VFDLDDCLVVAFSLTTLGVEIKNTEDLRCASGVGSVTWTLSTSARLPLWWPQLHLLSGHTLATEGIKVQALRCACTWGRWWIYIQSDINQWARSTRRTQW